MFKFLRKATTAGTPAPAAPRTVDTPCPCCGSREVMDDGTGVVKVHVTSVSNAIQYSRGVAESLAARAEKTEDPERREVLLRLSASYAKSADALAVEHGDA